MGTVMFVRLASEKAKKAFKLRCVEAGVSMNDAVAAFVESCTNNPAELAAMLRKPKARKKKP